MIIINDTHLGVTRQAGTTPASQLALREYANKEFARLVNQANHLVINGDLFDGFTIDTGVLIDTHVTLRDHIDGGGQLTLIMGNHDASAKGDKVSSFHLLAYVLETSYPDSVHVIDHENGLTRVCEHVWSIPHMLNQSLFDIELDKAVAMGGAGDHLLLHANCDCQFAEHSDHSLNVTDAQLNLLIDAGWNLVFAHEHQQRLLKNGKVHVVGNQIPTSIADCLGNKNQAKYFARIEGDVFESVQCLDLKEIFCEINWRELGSVPEDMKFVRVTGDCASEEAADMISAVSKLRQRHQAFVIGNAVKIEGIAQMEALTEMTQENMTKFDVLGALMSELNEREQIAVKGLLS